MLTRPLDVDQLVDNYLRNWVEALMDRREGKIGIHGDLTLVQGNLRDAIKRVLDIKIAERVDG